MKVLYDHKAFTFQRFGGVSKCFCELIAQMPEDVEAVIAVKESDNVHLLASGLCRSVQEPVMNFSRWKRMLPFKGSGLIFRMLMNSHILSTAETKNEEDAVRQLREGDFDVFHPTFFDSYFLKYIGDKPWVFTVHDMMPEIFPQYFKPNNEQTAFKRKYLPKAAHIIAVSENTKKDLVRIMGVPESRITVVYHGGPQMENVADASLIDSPYILYVGTRDAYKNFPQTLADFADFRQNHPEVKFVCTGGDFTSMENRMIEKLGIGDAVVHISADEHDMKVLYAHAVAFVYPSLYEGFGMPILEAFAYGCPVLLNNKSCFPEIAADAGVYFDSVPGKSDLPEVMEHIWRLSKTERQNLVENGYRRLGEFSWRKSAEKLAGVYREVCRSTTYPPK